MAMTSEKYAANGGCKCPCCESTSIEGGFIEVDSNIATQNMWCNECEANWDDAYIFNCIQNLKEK